MAVKSRTVNVGTTATPLSSSDDSRADSWFEVLNPTGSAATIYVGGADVTTANGRPVAAGQAQEMPVHRGDRVHAIVASGTVDVSVLETGVA